MKSFYKKAWVAGVLLLGGCASVSDSHPDDPLEPLNRSIFKFNTVVDDAVVKPAAKVYVKAVPGPARQGVRNVLGNVDDSWSFVNALLQGNREAAGQDLGRVLVNSSLGLAGLLDVATAAGIERQEEDLGQTFAVWGIPKGPYLVLPFLGPTTVRDGVGQAAWSATNPLNTHTKALRYSTVGLRLLDARSQALDMESVLEDATLDRYGFVRSAYWQRRAYLVRDGQPLEHNNNEYEDDAPATAPSAAPASPAASGTSAPDTVKSTETPSVPAQPIPGTP